MMRHSDLSKKELSRKIKSGEIVLAGNLRLKIYGLLGCKSGKRMTRMNRVFFTSEREALTSGFRPCGHCMHIQYQTWKSGYRSVRASILAGGKV